MGTRYYLMREAPLAYLFFFFFGIFGVHQFYLGHIQKGFWILALFLGSFLSLLLGIGLMLYNVEVSSSVTSYGTWMDSFAITVPDAEYRHDYIPWWIFVVFFGIGKVILVIDFFTIPRQVRELNLRLRGFVS